MGEYDRWAQLRDESPLCRVWMDGQEMARLQQASRRLIALTGRLQQRLPAETYSRLSQMDVYMS